MKEKANVHLQCSCGAEYDLTGIDIGGLDLMTLPVYVKGAHPDASEPHNSMIFAESLNAPDTCDCSEQLVWVKRPDETDEEWADRHGQRRADNHPVA